MTTVRRVLEDAGYVIIDEQGQRLTRWSARTARAWYGVLLTRTPAGDVCAAPVPLLTPGEMEGMFAPAPTPQSADRMLARLMVSIGLSEVEMRDLGVTQKTFDTINDPILPRSDAWKVIDQNARVRFAQDLVRVLDAQYPSVVDITDDGFVIKGVRR